MGEKGHGGAQDGGHIVLESEDIYRGDYISMRKDIVRFPSGHVGTREVIHHPGAVGVLVVTADGRIPLVTQYRHATSGPVLEIPAGLLDPGETPAECARREVREEVGGTGGNLTSLGWFYTTPGNSDEVLHLFLLEGAELGEADPEDGEELDLSLVTPAEARRMVASGEIVDSKTIIGVLRAFGSERATAREYTEG